MRPKNEETKKKIYEFINEYIQTNRVSPTVREIASGTNCAVSTAYKFMVRLQEEGLIDMAGRRHIVSSVNSWAMKSAPILGMVACGKPQTAIQDIQGYLPLNMDYFGSGEYFALVAEGDSMVNVGIDEGDLVIVRTISIKAEAAAVGDTSCRVHMSTLREGMVKSVFSRRMSPLSRASCTNSSVTPATPSPILARDTSRLREESSISGVRVMPLCRKYCSRNTRLLALRSSRIRGKSAISCRVYTWSKSQS